MKSTFMMKQRIEKIMMRFIFSIWTAYKKLFLRKGNKACLHPACLHVFMSLQWNIRASLRPGSRILVWSYIYKYKVQGSWRLVQNLPSSFTKKRANTTQNLAQQFFYFIFKFGFDWSGGGLQTLSRFSINSFLSSFH